MIRNEVTRIVRGRVPASVRKELSNSVKAGLLGHLAKDGLKPEVFFHPDHRQAAIDLQNRVAIAAIGRIASVITE